MRPHALGCSLALSLAGCVRASPPAAAPGAPESPGFELEGRPFCFVGSSNYYPIYKSESQVRDLFASAQSLGFKVMRVWGMLDRGSLDGSVPNVDGSGEKDGVYFQYWDPALGRPAFNDGASGLQRLDRVLAAAAAHDVKLIVVLTNNWREFGGIDQYVTWYGLRAHHEFFTEPGPREAYRAWLSHVIGRRNTVNGRLYAEDPTLFGWELANEPRCKNGGPLDSPDGWDSSVLTRWADEMSSHVKQLDPNHLVSVGDEGFLQQGGEHWAYRGNDGVDHAALTALSHVDFGTFHLYPEDWGTPPGFAERWISDHLRVGRELGKPSVLEEYGIKSKTERAGAYQRWNDLLLREGGSGALSWMLAGDGYPDYDGFAYYRGDATGKLLGGYATRYSSAPACSTEPTSSRPSTPFVRVRRPPRRVALGWL
jgi:mannan endo-1,4-beta-mannosidase